VEESGTWVYFVLRRRARRVHALGLSMLASYYVKPQKFHPGPGYVLFVSVLSLDCVSHMCFARVGLRIGTGFLFVPDFQDNLSPTKTFRYNTTCLLRMTYKS
jgi:hypothetical protein